MAAAALPAHVAGGLASLPAHFSCPAIQNCMEALTCTAMAACGCRWHVHPCMPCVLLLCGLPQSPPVSRNPGPSAVAVDAYCLLHKGAYTCARELVEGEPTERHVAYCMSRMELLLGAGVTPLVVFDGGRLPNKGDEERSRQRSREENRARARALWAAGNRTAAMECYQKAVDITPAHAKQFVEVGAAQRAM